MDTTSLSIGMPILAKIGRNVIRATVHEILNDHAVIVRNLRTNHTFTVSVTKVELDPDGVAPTPAAPSTEPPKKKTLLAIAYEVLEDLRRPMSTAEILDIATERGTFKPEEWGHTPTLTLYGTFVRETKKDSPKVRKSEARGKWELVETPAN